MFRRFLEWEWYDQTSMVRLFLHILLKANYEDKKWHGVVIKRGQLVTSFANLSAETGLSLQVIRSCLDKLQRTGEVNKQSTSQYTIITVCKYADYQQCEDAEQQTNNKQITSEQQASNNRATNEQQQHKNIRKKEYKNIYTLSNERESDAVASEPKKASKDVVDFAGLISFFNRAMEQAKAIIPRCQSCEGKRREFVRARIREHGMDKVYEMITKASESDFLNGKNERGWIADFTWLFRPSNFQKVLEGNYDNRTNNYNETNNHKSSVGGNPTNNVTGFVVHRSKN